MNHHDNDQIYAATPHYCIMLPATNCVAGYFGSTSGRNQARAGVGWACFGLALVLPVLDDPSWCWTVSKLKARVSLNSVQVSGRVLTITSIAK